MLEIKVKIDGMACSMCESHICDVIRKNFDVKKVSASHRKGEAVILSEENIADVLIISAIERTGYHVTGIEKSEYVKKSRFGFFSK